MRHNIMLKELYSMFLQNGLYLSFEEGLYTSYLSVGERGGFNYENFYIDTTSTGKLQLRRKLPCDGFHCFNIDDKSCDQVFEIICDDIKKDIYAMESKVSFLKKVIVK